MSKSKISLIIAAILIIVGIVGSILTGIKVIPKNINFIINSVKEYIYAETEVKSLPYNVEKLNVTTSKDVKLEIRRSFDNNTRIKTNRINKSYYNIEDIYMESDKTLILDIKTNRIFDNIHNIYEQFEGMNASFTEYDIEENLIIIEVPNQVDINIEGNEELSLDIKDDGILKNDLKIKYNKSIGYSTFNIPNNNKLKNLQIINAPYINLEVLDFINAKSVEIQGSHIDIKSTEIPNDYDLNNIPESISVRGNDINITSYVPLGKDVDIYAEHKLNYTSNFEDYNYVGNIDSKAFKNKDENKEGNVYEYYNEDYDILRLKNLSFVLNEGKYSGKLSGADGYEYRLNISVLGCGDIVNDSKTNIKNNILMNMR